VVLAWQVWRVWVQFPSASFVSVAFSFLCLSALSYLADLPYGEEKRKDAMEETKYRIKKTLISTLWAIGTGMWSGAAALSG
jgi:hypothetical protein